jgi:hypothetical protein
MRSGPIKIEELYSSVIRDFVHLCPNKKINIKYYLFIRGESERNLVKAVEDLLKRYHLESQQNLKLKCADSAKKKLDKLFDEKMIGDVENCTEDEVYGVNDFFKSNEKDICKYLGLKVSKPNIPEDPDCKLIACVNNEEWNAGYILSDDGHFIGYKPELHKNFNICVLPTTELLKIMRAWNWTK